MEWQDKIAIANYGLTALTCFLGVYAGLRVVRKPNLHEDAVLLVTGLTFMAGGLGMHQVFWFIRWWLLADNQLEATQWFLNNSWLLSGPYSLLHIGAAMVAYALYRDNCFIQSIRVASSRGWVSGIWRWLLLLMCLWMVFFLSIP